MYREKEMEWEAELFPGAPNSGATVQPVSGARIQHDQGADFYLNHLVLVPITHYYDGL